MTHIHAHPGMLVAATDSGVGLYDQQTPSKNSHCGYFTSGIVIATYTWSSGLAAEERTVLLVLDSKLNRLGWVNAWRCTKFDEVDL